MRSSAWAVGALLSLGAGGGCASYPSEQAEALMEDVLCVAGLPRALEGFDAQSASVGSRTVTAHYLRLDPPGELWILRFGESPNEQHPEDVRSLSTLLSELSASKESFTQGDAVSVPGPGGAKIEGISYAFVEKGRPLAGVVCLWADRPEAGAWVWVLNVVAPDRPPLALIGKILEDLGGG